MHKKAQGLSLTTIVIAALALIVLVVLVLIFTGRLGGFTSAADEAAECKNYCKAIGKEGKAGQHYDEKNPPDKKCVKDDDLLARGVLYESENGIKYYCCCE